MKPLSRDQVQAWIEELELEAYVCADCEGIHLTQWESKDGVLECRCFVEKERVSLITEIALRPSVVLPLLGAVQFMNYDFNLLKVMISMTDQDVPRLILTHTLPSKHLTEAFVKDWIPQLLAEMTAVYTQLTEMEVLMIDEDVFLSESDDKLH